ncbi:uncharacterized protein LOC116130025 [Pistacia vera]|uniref:uncharacterized protein LOC116130025 n=1 Tax=Pistacia vera TaxID=55513 RepID=UPI00126343BD|nr:uncharacterized protein LOC116130025 [Pistacia vera]
MIETWDIVCLPGEETTMKKTTVGLKRLHATKNDNYTVVPQWIIVMYNKEFFGNCMAHPNTKKNEVDRFCIDCLSSLCCHCLPFHTRHRYVKIRRYVYNDVINRHDLSKLFNCSGIQTYHTNKTKVLFLKQRNPHQQQQPQQINSKDYGCIICDRNLQDNSLYCSIACKVNEDEDKEYLTPPSPKRQKQKRSRKGIPLRAPML